MDADAGNNMRKIVAFVGGLDLCDGRYDTPHHPILRTLQTLHKDDYHNPTFTVISYFRLHFVAWTRLTRVSNQSFDKQGMNGNILIEYLQNV